MKTSRKDNCRAARIGRTHPLRVLLPSERRHLERDDELLVVADVPGAKGDAIDVKFEDGTLEIQAAVTPRQSDDHSCLLQEYEVGDYIGVFKVSETIDAGKISAQYANGVLTLHLPKAEALKPRKIAVAAN